MKTKKEALDDAISSTQVAVAEGIVPGGGLALLKCIEAVSQEENSCRGDEKDRRRHPEASAGGARSTNCRKLRGRMAASL